MNRIVFHVTRWLVAGLAFGLASGTQATYVFTSIDYPNAVQTDIRGINNRGQIVGYTVLADDTQFGVVYTSGTYSVLPPVPGAQFSSAIGINDAGHTAGVGSVIVGGNFVGSFGTIFNGSSYATFSRAPTYSFTEGRAIGSTGLVTGFAYEANSNVAFIYDPVTSSFTDITTGGPSTLAQGINTAGQVVGSVTGPNGLQAFLYQPGGSLSYFQINGNPTAARGINDNGLITGFFLEPSGLVLSFVGNSGGYQTLQIPGAQQTAAEGINNAGQVVGVWIDAAGNLHGFIATPAALPSGTTAGGAYTFSTAVVPNTPIFIDPVVAIGYDFATGASDPNFATVSPPIGIGDSKYTVVIGAQSFDVAGGDVFDFRTHGFPSGVAAFGIRGIEMSANLDPANQQAFPVAVSFMAAGMFTGTMLPLSAQVFVVTNNNDSGTGSLRDAVALANADPGPNMITFDPSVVGTITLSGQIQISEGPLTIAGPGADVLTIDGGAINRIFIITEPSPPAPACPALTGPVDYPVTLSGLTLVNAHRNTDNSGGAIFSTHSLTVDSVVLRDNAAKAGAGISFLTQYPGQSLTITNSKFYNNIAKPLSAVTSNQQGGALRIAENCGGATINTAIPVTVTISNSLFEGNRVQPVALGGHGGALYTNAYADITISDSRIVDNHVDAPNPPVAGQTYQGGGIRGFAKSLTITRSEISDNIVFDATASDQTRSGGLHVFNVDPNLQAPADAMAIKIVNSTISGNSASASAGAMQVSGNVALELDNSTVSNNSAAANRTGGIIISTAATSPPSAGNAAAPTFKMVSSILANSAATTLDLAGNATTIPTFTVDATNSLIETICAPSATCSTISVAGSGNLIATDPMLTPLAFNGGPTRTQALFDGSPALETGSNPLSLTTDQRGTGFPRTVGALTDMGAYEGSVPPLPPVLQSAKSRKVHGGVTYDLPLSLADIHNPTTEPRQSITATIVFTFDKPIASATAAVTESAATAGTLTFSGNDVIVPLSGIVNPQYVTVTLSGVTGVDATGPGSGLARVGFLLGDVNGNRVVTLSDVGSVNAQLAQAVNSTNYLRDLNVSGTLSLADKAIANTNLTKSLPAP